MVKTASEEAGRGESVVDRSVPGGALKRMATILIITVSRPTRWPDAGTTKHGVVKTSQHSLRVKFPHRGLHPAGDARLVLDSTPSPKTTN